MHKVKGNRTYTGMPKSRGSILSSSTVTHYSFADQLPKVPIVVGLNLST